MEAHHRVAGHQDPNVLIGQAEQLGKLARPLQLLNDHRRRDPTLELGGFEA